MIPYLYFKLMVNNIGATTIKKANALGTKCVKTWLGLTRSTSVAVLHHPDVLNIPFLSSYRTKAKLTYLSSVIMSRDPLIEEIADLSTTAISMKHIGIPKDAKDALHLGIESVEEISRKTFPKVVKVIFDKMERSKWDERLSRLTVQNKFIDACVLEKDSGVWRRILQGLPSRQLSFLLRAASDTLPTPLNLVRWRYRVDPTCSLCGSHTSTTKHILNACPVALSQGRYSWRHDSILKKILFFLRQHLTGEEKLYGDLNGFRAMENPPSTVPPDLLPTSDRPDIVFIREDNKVIIIELTVPFNSPDSINTAHNFKTSKYQILLSDLETRGYIADLVTIEVVALGHYFRRSCSSLHRVLPSLSKTIIRKLMDDTGKLAITASQRIFMARREEYWNSAQSLLC